MRNIYIYIFPFIENSRMVLVCVLNSCAHLFILYCHEAHIPGNHFSPELTLSAQAGSPTPASSKKA